MRHLRHKNMDADLPSALTSIYGCDWALHLGWLKSSVLEGHKGSTLLALISRFKVWCSSRGIKYQPMFLGGINHG